MYEQEQAGMTPKARRMRELDSLIDEIFGPDFLVKERVRSEKPQTTNRKT
ncbi:MAG: hypothetical protein RE472_05320 [Thermoplasmatales archaeon]|jgi:hypothetical protein|nr:MAG: hypothetical protein RE472_05320 [Thermoplasmatales archaeon]